MKTTILLTIEHKKPLPDITDVICQRVWPYGGGCITDMTAAIQEEPKDLGRLTDYLEAHASAAVFLAGLAPAPQPGFWARVWSRA